MGKKKKHSRDTDSDAEGSSPDEKRSMGDDHSAKRKKKEKKKKSHKRKRASSESSGDDREQREGRDVWMETAQEEKAAKKAAREAKKVAGMFGYTNSSNPFGDSNLHQQFVWKAKVDQDKKSGRQVALSAKEESERRLMLVKEIEKVRQRREEREKEIEEMERLKAEEARLREAAMYDDWEKKEEEFHLQQARVRSKIRLVEGREKPIDLLAKNLLLFGDDEETTYGVKYKGKTELDMSQLEAELREPYMLFYDLSLEEMKELQKDIREYQQLEGKGPNKEFWDALALVCKHELRAAGRMDGKAEGSLGGGVHTAVSAELHGMFDGKSVKQFDKMRSDIQRRLETNDGTVDTDYWENVLVELEVFRAKAFLRESHQQMLLRQLERLEERRAELSKRKAERLAEGDEAGAEREEDEEQEEEDEGGQRREVRPGSVPPPETFNMGYDDSTVAVAMVESERRKGLDKDEETLGRADEVEVADKVYWWHDKYRPRRPRYFNRVKTGWDWNKYNQTHYDHDNPPPKTVQGYKFNIFYPDLIDKTKTPRFFLEAADSPDFCIIRFHAGPPYEDIAFKIINREWERSHKRGFKCSFERGILSLHVNFKRLRYRR